jgi:hypothetical protein
MLSRTSASLERLLEALEHSPTPLDTETMIAVGREIGKLFEVAPDEVALLELGPSGKSLRFVLPPKLRAVGEIPLTSTTALAARTARERRADIVNNFASSRHASVFEGVPMGRQQDEVIQKIISAPVLQGDNVIGVAQISRKGASLGEAGPDFTPKDLSELQGIGSLLRRFLSLPRE